MTPYIYLLVTDLETTTTINLLLDQIDLSTTRVFRINVNDNTLIEELLDVEYEEWDEIQYKHTYEIDKEGNIN